MSKPKPDDDYQVTLDKARGMLPSFSSYDSLRIICMALKNLNATDRERALRATGIVFGIELEVVKR